MANETMDFYLDPVCPWTWLTSRWLVDVATQRDLSVRWRPFSLALLNEGRLTPPQFDTPEFREKTARGADALRVLTVLGEEGEHDAAGEFYGEFGRRFHDGADTGEGDVVEAAAAAAGVDEWLARADADTVDAVIRARLAEAIEVAGPDVGSPVLRIDGAARGLHGPIITPRLTGDAATQLFDAIAVLQAQDAFFEIKRGRTDGPAVGGDR